MHKLFHKGDAITNEFNPAQRHKISYTLSRLKFREIEHSGIYSHSVSNVLICLQQNRIECYGFKDNKQLLKFKEMNMVD